jgi:hypothetical protein
MSPPDVIPTLKESVRALRVISSRRTVCREDENDLRLLADNLESLAFELAAQPRRPPPKGHTP